MKKNRKGTTNLASDEAYKIIYGACRGIPYNGRDIGNRFRLSCLSFSARYSEQAWIIPPQTLRLDIDDVIEKLLKRNASPKISKSDNEPCVGLRLWGPFDLARSHLLNFGAWCLNPPEDEQRNLRLNSMLGEIKSARSLLEKLLSRDRLNFLGIPNQTFKQIGSDSDIYWEAFYRKTEATLNGLMATANDLAFLSDTIELELMVSSEHKQRTGRPRDIWKAEFVSYLAHLWRVLTREEASRSPASLFGEFVDAAWRSFDENVPEVSFDRAIRERR